MHNNDIVYIQRIFRKKSLYDYHLKIMKMKFCFERGSDNVKFIFKIMIMPLGWSIFVIGNGLPLESR